MATSEKTYEMLWDCKYCGSKKLLGKTHRHCPSCGAPQDPGVRYFPADDEKVAVEDHVFVGADRLCPACGVANGRAANNCGACGSPLDAAAAVAKRADQVVPDAPTGAAAAGQPNLAVSPKAGPLAKKGCGCLGAGTFLTVLVSMLLLVVASCCGSKDANFEVAGHAWQRDINVERYAAVQESDWCDEMPSGAEDVSRSRQQKSTRDVADGEQCSTRKVDNGDGTYKELRECKPKMRKEPVYADKCRYKIRKWKHERIATASGTSLAEAPKWPDVKLTRTGTCDGCEREGERSEKYTVRFVDSQSKEEKRCEYSDQSRWSSYATGSRWAGKVGNLTGSIDCDSLQPQN